jgi:DNA-binding NtrC family response regulator
VFPITVPPLRERPQDIAELVRHFLARFNAEEGKRIRAVAAEAIAMLQRFSWPGNVRQLENAIFRAVVLAEGDEIGTAEFPQIAYQVLGAPSLGAGSAATAPSPDIGPPAAPLLVEQQPLATAERDGPHPPPAAGVAILDQAGDFRPLDAIESDIIRFAIVHYNGQMSEIARKLQIGRSTLYRKLKELGFEDSEKPESESVAAE